jgi:hypothetical protein
MALTKICDGKIKSDGKCSACGNPLPAKRTKQVGPHKNKSADRGRKCERKLVWSEEKFTFVKKKKIEENERRFRRQF